MPTPESRPVSARALVALLVAFVMFFAAVAPVAASDDLFDAEEAPDKGDGDTGDDDEPVVHDGSLDTVNARIGAAALHEGGVTGAGVQVAVIDTGVAPVPALAAPGKVVTMVDLSFEADIPEARFLDTYGHGTHMSGIIAGHDPVAGFTGVAPGAELVSLKVGDNTGAVDVSQVVAAIDFLVENNGTNGLNVRVLNLSYGVNIEQDRTIDPLHAAVERAWDAGIVVVVAVGNDGKHERNLADPASNPFVIAVGAADISEGKPRAATFSTSGDGDRNPDVIAPGVSLESLRAPGSRSDVEHPEARVGDDRFKGSGSSQAAAVVSGSVALLLEIRPELTPDEVKAILIATTEKASGGAKYRGSGMVDIRAAVEAEVPSNSTQDHERSDGSGSLEASRGDDRVVINGELLEGEVIWTGASWSGASWSGASWSGASWSGASWSGASWSGASWSGASWSGASWSGASWSGDSWKSAVWMSAVWA